MKRAKYLAWLFLVCVTVGVWESRLHAFIACSPPSCDGCSSCVKRYGCSWNIDQNASPSNCNSAIATCSSYCDQLGGISDVDGEVSCPSGQGAHGFCYCKNTLQCPPAQSCSCQESEACCSGTCQGTWVPNDNTCDTGSPILINLANDGSDHLTSVEDGVLFDLNARGVRDRIAWTHAGSPVAFLVLDRNGNGLVDDGTELFGTATAKRDGTRAANGFDALYDLDGGSGVSDWQIDARDPVYDRLRLWIDRNHNGRSEPDELRTLRQEGVISLFLSYTEGRHRDSHGNWYRYESRADIREHGHDVTRRVFDVFLKISLTPPQS